MTNVISTELKALRNLFLQARNVVNGSADTASLAKLVNDVEVAGGPVEEPVKEKAPPFKGDMLKRLLSLSYQEVLALPLCDFEVEDWMRDLLIEMSDGETILHARDFNKALLKAEELHASTSFSVEQEEMLRGVVENARAAAFKMGSDLEPANNLRFLYHRRVINGWYRTQKAQNLITNEEDEVLSICTILYALPAWVAGVMQRKAWMKAAPQEAVLEWELKYKSKEELLRFFLRKRLFGYLPSRDNSSIPDALVALLAEDI